MPTGEYCRLNQRSNKLPASFSTHSNAVIPYNKNCGTSPSLRSGLTTNMTASSTSTVCGVAPRDGAGG